jgi:hypothetical protein
VFLTGWKEIAAYLKCGVRTAQRWQLEYHLPIARVRTKRKGLVMAESERLDDWIRNRPLLKSKPILQASQLFHEITRQAVEFVRAEVNMAHRFAELASMSKDEAAVARRTKAARRAYDVAQKLVYQSGLIPEDERREFLAHLDDLKSILKTSGEDF